ncbi:MAG: DUF58 domain-containing protein [Neomegalonema sp.]|nr:DUF58 domain-containing protein [Neomegalonema sp.]
MSAADQPAKTGRGVAELRRDAERRASGLPRLLAQAERLAATVQMGAHGRRRAGPGETFWQYRRAMPGDPYSSIDWRRSARSDMLFVRETEWEAAQTIWLWCDRSQSMSYRSSNDLPTKLWRASEIALALAILLLRGGERVALIGTDAGRPNIGETQIGRIAQALMEPEQADYGAPPAFDAARGGRVVFIGDFFAEESALLGAVKGAAGLGLSGLMLQTVDPAEESFPFDGRVVFESMAGALRYETERAGALKNDYIAAMQRRRRLLDDTCRRAAWRFQIHRTGDSPAPALMWLAQGLAQSTFSGGLR